MRITGARVFCIDQFIEKDLYIRNGRIANHSTDEPTIHADGLYAIPGLVDIHFHGAVGYDFSDGTIEAIEKIAEYEVSNGITAICPATMTLPVDQLLKVMHAAKDYSHSNMPSTTGKEKAALLGINLEGPFINPKRAGAQDPVNVRPADWNLIQTLQEESGGLIRLVDLAPEFKENMDFIKSSKSRSDKIHLSIAHTDCGYECAKKAFAEGADHMTHLFNAMPGLNHRAPGPIAAGLEEGAFAEIIADGIHVHPAMVRMAFRLFGADRMILISDSMRACGMKDGIYNLGGQDVQVSGRKATLANDPTVLAGSVTNLYECLKIAVKEMQIPLIDAVRAATYNPARSIGIDDEVGSFLPGRQGRVLLLNEDLEIVKIL